jgi:two-component system chemotaxis response regulator CheY
MLLVTTHAEQKLNEYLHTIKAAGAPLRRALHIRHFTGLYEGEGERSQIAAALFSFLGSLLEHSDMRIFRCHNDDLILIGKDITAAHYQAINIHLIDHYFVDGSCVSFYEQSRNWFPFTNICKDLLEKCMQQRATAKNDSTLSKRQRIREAALNQELSPELIRTLAKRRHEREAIEVMVVEDDAFSRKLVCSALRTAGYGVTAIENGHNAIGGYPLRAPDVMFLDIDLPDVSGHDVLQKILSIDPEAYVVILSANHNEANVLGAIKKGAKGFVAKPFTKGKLLSYIEKAPTYHPVAS